MKLYASARVRQLRPEILSLTLGLLAALFSFTITLVAIAGGGSGRLIALFEAIYPWYSLSVLGLLFSLFWGFFYGYILGFLIAYLYTLLVRKMILKNAKDFILEFDPDKAVNVIQEGEGAKPYTIAIVANPVIYHKAFRITDDAIACLTGKIPANVLDTLKTILNHPPDLGRANFLRRLRETIGAENTEQYNVAIFGCSEFYEGEVFYERDPIFDAPDIFWKAVIRCVKSFVNNELLRLPEIFPRLRMVVIHDHKKAHDLEDKHALCETIDPEFEMIAPRAMRENDDFIITSVVYEYVKNYIDYADVILVLSNSPKFIRSAARFTEERNGDGKEFIYKNNFFEFHRKHAFYPTLPGLAAIWALDDRLKTPVHEFAHAMSSFQNGPIADEYDDEGEFSFDFMVNKQFRRSSTDPVPRFYVKYKLADEPDNCCAEYCSDRTRADKEPTWRSYVPERIAPGYSSIMDIAYDDYRFSKLVFDFMYDRLLIKLNRTGRS